MDSRNERVERRRFPASLHLTSVIVALGAVSCGGPPSSPSPTAPSPNSPAPSSTPTAIRLEGPASLAPGVTARYTVTATYANGSTRDLTGESTILRYPIGHNGEDILQVTPDGLVTGGTQGEIDLQAYYPRLVSSGDTFVIPPGAVTSSRLRVFVLEPGTFRVSGRVTESGLPMPSVHVTVVSGRRSGLTVLTDGEGSYALYGLAGASEIVASEESFQTASRTVVVDDHQTVDFNLQPLAGYDSLTGDWRLTFQASPTCAGELPAEAMTRSFDARLTQRGSQLTVELYAPTRVILEGYPERPFGGVAGDAVGFYMQSDSTEDRDPPRWTLLERLDPQRFLGISGPSNGTRQGRTITGTLSGYFSVYRSTGPSYLSAGTVLEASCLRKIGFHSSLHSFRLERR
jgi:hypothetical protein